MSLIYFNYTNFSTISIWVCLCISFLLADFMNKYSGVFTSFCSLTSQKVPFIDLNEIAYLSIFALNRNTGLFIFRWWEPFSTFRFSCHLLSQWHLSQYFLATISRWFSRWFSNTFTTCLLMSCLWTPKSWAPSFITRSRQEALKRKKKNRWLMVIQLKNSWGFVWYIATDEKISYHELVEKQD